MPPRKIRHILRQKRKDLPLGHTQKPESELVASPRYRTGVLYQGSEIAGFFIFHWIVVLHGVRKNRISCGRRARLKEDLNKTGL